MKRKSLLFFVIGSVLLLMTACGARQGSSSSGEPATIHKTLLLFDTGGKDTGSLYIKSHNKEPEHIGDNVKEGGVIYDPYSENVLYLDGSSNLYLYTGQSDGMSENIASNTSYANFWSQASEEASDYIFYRTEDDGNAYVYKDGISERINMDTDHLAILNDVIYSIDDGYLVAYNFETREEETLTSGVNAFKITDDKKGLIFTDDKGILFYYDLSDKNDRMISSYPVYLEDVEKRDDYLYFIENRDGNPDLLIANLKENQRPNLITENAQDFEMTDKGIVYKNNDSSLYHIEGNNAPRRLAADVAEFQSKQKQVYYMNYDYDLHVLDLGSGSDELVGRDVARFAPFSDGRVFYLTNDGNLFEGQTRLESELDHLAIFHETLAYAKDDTVYLYENKSNEAQVLADELQDYSTATYQNQLVYENLLSFSDLAGLWKSEDGDIVIEIKEDGSLYSYLDDDTVAMSENISEVDRLNATVAGSSVDLFFEGDQLVWDQGFNTFRFSQSSPEEAETLKAEAEEKERKEEEERRKEEEEEKKRKEAAEKEREEEREVSRAESVVESFINDLPYAVNYGDFNSILSLIDESSSFYQEQADFMEGLYDQGTTEYLNDYDILDASLNSDGTVTVRTFESFDVMAGDSGNVSTSEYEAVYSLEKDDGSYKITKLEVK